MNDLEVRTLTEPIEVRSAGGKTLTAAGVAVRYGSISKVLVDQRRGQFHERILAGAFKDSLNGTDVRFVHEHDRNLLLGRTASGTLRFEDTPTDLRYELDLPDTTLGRDVATMLERGDVAGSSVAMITRQTKAGWSKTTDGLALRSVQTSALDHVATTAWNAYDDSTASIALRSLADDLHVDLPSLIEASHTGALADLIASPGSDETETTTDEADDEDPVVIHRRPATWFV